MAKVGLSIILILFSMVASIVAQAGSVFIHNDTDRALLVYYELCTDQNVCTSANRFTLDQNKQIVLDLLQNNVFSVVRAISDGPDVDEWKGIWGPGIRIGSCAAQPLGPYSIVGNKITFRNFGGDPDIECIVSVRY